MVIRIIRGDITKLDESIECIVNAANESLLGGGGVDGAIHRAAGPELVQECATLGGCKTGEAKATKAYRLKQKYIIHTPGPIYRRCLNAAELLGNSYRNSLALADSLGCRSIAFCSISTGIYGYPLKEAAEVCAKAVGAFKGKNLKEAYMCLLPNDWAAYEAYRRAFAKAFGGEEE